MSKEERRLNIELLQQEQENTITRSLLFVLIFSALCMIAISPMAINGVINLVKGFISGDIMFKNVYTADYIISIVLNVLPVILYVVFFFSVRQSIHYRRSIDRKNWCTYILLIALFAYSISVFVFEYDLDFTNFMANIGTTLAFVFACVLGHLLTVALKNRAMRKTFNKLSSYKEQEVECEVVYID